MVPIILTTYLPKFLSTPYLPIYTSLTPVGRYVRLYIRLRYGMVEGMVQYNSYPSDGQTNGAPTAYGPGAIRDLRSFKIWEGRIR